MAERFAKVCACSMLLGCLDDKLTVSRGLSQEEGPTGENGDLHVSLRTWVLFKFSSHI